MSVGAYCQRNPRTASPDETIREAALRMMQEKVGALIVNDTHDRPDATRVSAVMSAVVGKAREGTLLATATTRMGADGVRRLPVVDPHGKTAGIFTYDDGLQYVASHLMAAADSIAAQAPAGAGVAPGGDEWEIPTARHYAQRPVTIRAEARAIDAVDEMFDHGVGCVVVVDGERVPQGILTDRDVLCRVVAGGLDPEKAQVEDVMSGDVVTVGEGASLEELLHETKSHAIRRVPLVDERGKLAGVVAVDDVVAQLHEELAALVSAVRVEMRESRLLGAGRRAHAAERL
jgi:CBS domain-containing protein